MISASLSSSPRKISRSLSLSIGLLLLGTAAQAAAPQAASEQTPDHPKHKTEAKQHTPFAPQFHSEKTSAKSPSANSRIALLQGNTQANDDDKKEKADKENKGRDNKNTPNTKKGPSGNNKPGSSGNNPSTGNKNNPGPNPQPNKGNNPPGNNNTGNKGSGNSPNMNKGNNTPNTGTNKLPGNTPKLPTGSNMPNNTGKEIKITPGNKLPANQNKGIQNKGDQTKHVKLDKLPTAPKPDLKITPPKAPNGNVKTPLDLDKNPMNKDLSKIHLEHHQDFKPNKFLHQPLSKLPVEKNGNIKPDNLKKLDFGNHKPDFAQQFQKGQFNQLLATKDAQRLQLKHQFQLLNSGGDLARRMNLVNAMQVNGGWQARKFGFVSSAYLAGAHSMMYCGPSYYPAHCWYPGWSPWVDWCWWDHCDPFWDPRPAFCRPIIYTPCPTWVYWHTPTWQVLPIVTCGTWIDVPVVTATATDLQMLAVRFVDPGHPDQGTGPRYRVWFRNNSPFRINQPFNVMLFAGNDRVLADGQPQAGIRVAGMDAGQIQTVDIRLPEAVNHLAIDTEGNAIPFNFLNVLTDSHNELADTFRPNNGATLARGDVLPVDPASFAADPFGTGVGGIINVAGEGFGPEPGQVLIQMAGLELQGEIEGWFDLGVRIRIPSVPLTGSASANIVVVRGDGAASNPITVEIAPSDSLSLR